MTTALPAELSALRTVAAAVVDREGVLHEANAGFLRLLPAADAALPHARVGHFFIRPSFVDLVRACTGADPAGYRGLLTLGDVAGVTHTLRGEFTASGAGFRLLAEHDIEDLERMNGAVLALNQEAVLAQREIAGNNASLRQNEARIIEVSLTDPLTGLGNRRKLDEALAIELARARRAGSPLSVLMADIDHFKRVNDEYGHPAGDRVLAGFARLLRSRTRVTDIVTRFGGEEFMLLFPDTSLDQAVDKAEKLRAALERVRLEPVPRPVTASFGAAQLRAGEDAADLLARVDAALYQAKAQGRNRVCVAPAVGFR